MAESLADFARRSGVSPATARSWKLREKIACNAATGMWQSADPCVALVTLSNRNAEPVAEAQRNVAMAESRESCAGCESLTARVETCERDNATLQRFIDGLRDRVADLESAGRQSVGSQPPRHGVTVRRNGRTEVQDGDYLDSQRWTDE